MILFVVPIGVGAAVYLEEYADRTQVVEPRRSRSTSRTSPRSRRSSTASSASASSSAGRSTSASSSLAGAITLALLVLPIVIIAGREAIRAVPPSIREGSLALGATQWQTIRQQVLPAAIPGIATGVILARLAGARRDRASAARRRDRLRHLRPEPFSPDGYSALPVQIFQYATRSQEEFQVLAAAGIIVMLGRARRHELVRDLAAQSLRAKVVGELSEQSDDARTH